MAEPTTRSSRSNAAASLRRRVRLETVSLRECDGRRRATRGEHDKSVADLALAQTSPGAAEAPSAFAALPPRLGLGVQARRRHRGAERAARLCPRRSHLVSAANKGSRRGPCPPPSHLGSSLRLSSTFLLCLFSSHRSSKQRRPLLRPSLVVPPRIASLATSPSQPRNLLAIRPLPLVAGRLYTSSPLQLAPNPSIPASPTQDEAHPPGRLLRLAQRPAVPQRRRHLPRFRRRDLHHQLVRPFSPISATLSSGS